MWPFFLTALFIAIADQLSKTWVRSFPEGHTIFQAGFFRIVDVHNTGAAFGLFQGHSGWLVIVDFLGIALLLLFALYLPRQLPFLRGWLTRVALGLVLGGTIGNLIDRLYFGYVTDFLDTSVWPVFNVADSAVTIGMIILVCYLLFSPQAKKSWNG
ncbi:MAG: signal peptidase II [Chloroflexota bacterium]